MTILHMFSGGRAKCWFAKHTDSEPFQRQNENLLPIFHEVN